MRDIIATIGPKSEPHIEDLARAGVTAFRLNLSHNVWSWHESLARRIAGLGAGVEVMFDTRGNEVRILTEGELCLTTDEEFTLHRDPEARGHTRLNTSVKTDVSPGQQGFCGSGEVTVELLEVADDTFVLKALNEGCLRQNMHLHMKGVSASLPLLTPDDTADIARMRDLGVPVHSVAFSFAQDPEELSRARSLLPDGVEVLAKIETLQGIERAREILGVSDGVIVARGDLALEISLLEMPLAQRRLVGLARELDRQCIVATGLLRSMVSAPHPSRAEVNDIAHAVWQGATGLLVSDETAIGDYPLEVISYLVSAVEIASQGYETY